MAKTPGPLFLQKLGEEAMLQKEIEANRKPLCPDWAGGFGTDTFGSFADLVWGDKVYRLRWVPSGNFHLGSEKELGYYDDEGPCHLVTITKGFWLGETPVPQEFYQVITSTNPSRFIDKPKHPVERVSWLEAQSFCQNLHQNLPNPKDWQLRLPSEAEWEYACRAGTQSPLYNGTNLTAESGSCENLNKLAWYNKNSNQSTQPVKKKLPNNWGLYDMLGNVWEWCLDRWHGNYAGAPDTEKPWLDDEKNSDNSGDKSRYRVIRGGSWFSFAGYCRCACRIRFEPDFRDFILGFRFVLAPRTTDGPD